MRVALTGTPGTGKTSASAELDPEFDVVHLNDAVREEGLWTEEDADRDSLVVDVDAVREWLADRSRERAGGGDGGDGGDDGDTGGDGEATTAAAAVELVESHLAHHLDADRVVVLRCRPDELERRLCERGEAPSKARENAESEALDVVLSEAVERHGADSVYEIDATDRTPADVADEVRAVVAGDRAPSAGTVDYLDYLDA